jgi:hypothetical protein
MSHNKFHLLSQGSQITPPHQLNHTFKFKDYSPHAFAYLRRMFGVNEYEFLLSVCGNANYIEFQVRDLKNCTTHFIIFGPIYFLMPLLSSPTPRAGSFSSTAKMVNI